MTPVVLDVARQRHRRAPALRWCPAALRLVDPASGQSVVQVVVAGQGTWTVVDGAVRFEPADGFSGQVTPIRYSVADVNGTTTQASVDVYVEAPGRRRSD